MSLFWILDKWTKEASGGDQDICFLLVRFKLENGACVYNFMWFTIQTQSWDAGPVCDKECGRPELIFFHLHSRSQIVRERKRLLLQIIFQNLNLKLAESSFPVSSGKEWMVLRPDLWHNRLNLGGVGIPYRHLFVSRLLHFWSSFGTHRWVLHFA